jgi:hypothetical protein
MAIINSKDQAKQEEDKKSEAEVLPMYSPITPVASPLSLPPHFLSSLSPTYMAIFNDIEETVLRHFESSLDNK